MNAYLPHSVRLPFGYTVAVKTRSERTLRKIAGGAVDGCWDVATRTIYVDQGLSEQEQRYILTHELIHAFVDWQHHALGGAVKPSKPRAR